MTKRWRVSIHAPARGATGSSIMPSMVLVVFQSTHPRGVRPIFPAPACPRFPVSIHAPARGATDTATRERKSDNRFQSTHPRGVRLPAPAKAVFASLFQSTHPRGVRLDDGDTPETVAYVSIHAPARGATAPLPSPLNRAFERQNARTSAFWAFFHAVFLKQTVFSLFFSQLPLRGFHWETSVSLRFPFFRFCSFLLSRGAVFQNTSGPSGSMAVLAPTCSSRFFQLAPRK